MADKKKNKKVECHMCDGKGYISQSYVTSQGKVKKQDVVCYVCSGTGELG